MHEVQVQLVLQTKSCDVTYILSGFVPPNFETDANYICQGCIAHIFKIQFLSNSVPLFMALHTYGYHSIIQAP